jgi:EF hand
MRLAIHKALLSAVAMAGALACAAGAQAAQDRWSAEDVIIAIPSTPDAELLVIERSDSAEAAFQKMDVDGKGYIGKDEIHALPDFDDAFKAHDADQDGTLTAEEFRDAWRSYTGQRS